MIAVSVASPQDVVTLDYPLLKECARTVLAGEGIRDAKIILAFVDDATSARLHRQYLQEDGPTDVLTFPYSGPRARRLEGEIVIGVEVAAREARQRGHDVGLELCLYVIHGVLHLCGYDDRSPHAANTMRTKEREYLKRLNLPDIVDD